jgi:hypothetical protein
MISHDRRAAVPRLPDGESASGMGMPHPEARCADPQQSWSQAWSELESLGGSRATWSEHQSHELPGRRQDGHLSGHS